MKYYAQCQASAGNWYDVLGSNEFQDCVNHACYWQRERGAVVRVIERTDVAVWPIDDRQFED